MTSTLHPPRTARHGDSETEPAGATTPRCERPSRSRGVRDALRISARVVGWGGAVMIVLALGAISALSLTSQNKALVITGRSMQQTIPLGSVVIVEPVPAATLSRGDVITFDHPDGERVKVTHRVVTSRTNAAGETLITTKGDANASKDPWKISYVDGTAYRVMWHAPYVGRALLAVSTPIARLLLVVIPVLVLLVLVLGSIWRPARTSELAR
ncbi:MAG: signal peptidase I [Gaiellales bacterium]